MFNFSASMVGFVLQWAKLPAMPTSESQLPHFLYSLGKQQQMMVHVLEPGTHTGDPSSLIFMTI